MENQGTLNKLSTIKIFIFEILKTKKVWFLKFIYFNKMAEANFFKQINLKIERTKLKKNISKI